MESQLVIPTFFTFAQLHTTCTRYLEITCNNDIIGNAINYAFPLFINLDIIIKTSNAMGVCRFRESKQHTDLNTLAFKLIRYYYKICYVDIVN